MESTRPIRALMRGFDALTVLNLRDGVTVSEVAQEIRLPRTTAYRILETLGNAGFVLRDPADDRYRLTRQVKQLSSGFTDEAWVRDIAAPSIAQLCEEIVWPVSVATRTGTVMTLRETTDHATPLAIERYSAGIRVPLLGSSAGRVFLAFCPPTECENLLDQLAQSKNDDDKPARAPRADLKRMLADIRSEGYAALAQTRRTVEEINLSAPVLLEDRVLASLTVRFAASAMPLKAAVERFLPKLRRSAVTIAQAFKSQSPGAHGA